MFHYIIWFGWQIENFSNLFPFASWLKDCKYAISSWSRSKSTKCQLSSSSIERHMMLQAKTERQKHLPTRMKVAESLFKHFINLFHEITIVNMPRNEESTIKLQSFAFTVMLYVAMHLQLAAPISVSWYM